MTSTTPANWLRRFLDVEASGGILLLVATAAALLWANSPWSGSYNDLWHTEISLGVGDFSIAEDLRHWVNDALMALFFFVVGLEIKRELVVGELASRRAATLPAIAALGGMVLPALVYVAINAGGSGSRGWGIPMATDIAFAVSLLAVVGRRAPNGLKVLLLSLAIVDDIGAIVVIAVFYSGDLSLGWLALAALGVIATAVLARAGRWTVPLYVVLGAGVWVATFESGVHATIAGVALGLTAPAATVAPRFESALHPWTGYVVVPVFALANAGIGISADAIGDAVSSPVTLGVVAGLVIGKLVGVTGAAWLAVRSGVSTLPDGVTWPHIRGIAALAGIGFTVSLFITGLAFDDAAVQDEAKLGVLAASVIAALIGTGLLLRVRPAPVAADGRPPSRDEG